MGSVNLSAHSNKVYFVQAFELLKVPLLKNCRCSKQILVSLTSTVSLKFQYV